MKIAIGADHGGFALKEFLKGAFARAEWIDCGPASADSCDYPDHAVEVAEKVALREADFGVLVCRTGIGMGMAANRFHGVRAAVCASPETAALTRSHNGANVLCLGADGLAGEKALEILSAFVSAEVDQAERHARRRVKLERGGRLSEPSILAGEDPEVYAAVKAQIVQEDTEINLIASENYASRAVRA